MPTEQEVIEFQFNKLERLVRNLLIDNRNFKSQKDQLGYYFREYPNTYRYVAGPLKDQAEYILEEIESLKEFVKNYV